jgi:hypothetical protein
MVEGPRAKHFIYKIKKMRCSRGDAEISVIPAKAGIHILKGSEVMDPRLRGDDGAFLFSASPRLRVNP